MRGRCVRLLLLLSLLSFILFYFTTRQSSECQPTVKVAPRALTGEERAVLVRERCEQYPRLQTCTYPTRGILKRLLPVPEKRAALCVMGKTGSSNWKTLILLLRGRITEEEAENMTYPHSKEYWVDGGSVQLVNDTLEKRTLSEHIMKDYYRITFVRDPLSRLLSAYRDKFTGTSRDRMFRVYRNRRTTLICDSLQILIIERPDGDLIPQKIYSSMEEELNRNCRGEEQTVSLAMFFLILIFMPQDYRDKILLDTLVNTHFNHMLSMCDHCRMKYDFIGTVETMKEDFVYLKEKLGIEYDMPQIHSTQPGVKSKQEIQEMWNDLPYTLKQYIYMYLRDDALAFGYQGYESHIDDSLAPNHFEMRTKCKTKLDRFSV